MDFIAIAVAVFAGNIMTLSFIWGAKQAGDPDRQDNISWWALGAMALPMFFFIAVITVVLDTPTVLSATSH